MERPVARMNLQVVRALPNHRLNRLHGLSDDLGDLYALLPQVDSPLGNSRDVEQVIDQMGEMRDLALNDLDDAAGPGISGDDARQELARVAYRRQGIAQLVREHREKLILLLIRLFQLPALTLQRCMRLPPLCDIAGGAKPFLDLAIVIEQRNCPREGPSNGSVGTDHAVLELEHALVTDRYPDRLDDARAVLLEDIFFEP